MPRSVVDTLLIKRDERHRSDFELRSDIGRAALGSTLYHFPESDCITFVFPPRGVSNFLNRLIVCRLRAEGSSALIYDGNQYGLNAGPQGALEAFDELTDVVVQDATAIHELGRFGTMNGLAYSIGGVTQGRVAERAPVFDGFTFVVPGSKLAPAFYNGPRTRLLKDSYEQEGYTLEAVSTLWQDLNPDEYFGAYRGRNMRIVIAEKDLFIPYIYGRELVDEMREAGIYPSVYVSKMGHVPTMVAHASGLIK